MKRAWLIGTLLAAGGLLPALSVTAQPSSSAEATTPEQAIKKVCTGCHGLEIVMDTPRDYDAWHDTVQSMIDRGASGTQDEFGLVMEFLFENMTPVDVNHAGADALGAVLHATPQQVAAIVARRQKHSFKDLAELKAAIPGLNGPLLDAKKRMIFFQ
jgi:competence protein ComEA